MIPPRLTRAPGGEHRPARRRLLAAVLVVVTVTLASGCGLRLETDPPAPLVPDEIEQVRQRTTADAVALEVLAGQVVATDPAVLTLLGQVQTAGTAHLAALGGIYRPAPETGADGSAAADGSAGPDGGDGSAEGTGSADAETAAPAPADDPTTGAAVTGADLVTLLTETAASARADAGAVPDGPLARVLAAVAVARVLLADALTAALGSAGEPIEVEPLAAEPFEVPAELPAGLGEQDVAVLVRSEDAVGLTGEIVAARRSDQERAQAAERAAQHRQRAEDWARAAGISATGADPRRSTYALPREITDAAADPAAATATLARLEGELTADYASLVAAADTGARTPLVDAMLDAARAQARLTGVVPLFPGLPEQAEPDPAQG